MWEYNHGPSPDELYHYGIKGMKWGMRRRKIFRKFSRSTRHFNRESSRTSFTNIARRTMDRVGLKKSSTRDHRNDDYREAKQKARALRTARIRKVYESYMKDANNAQKQAKGDNVGAAFNRSKLYISQVSQINSEYKKQVQTAKKFIYGGD